MSNSGRRPLLIVISAPSGGGKSTLCQRLLGERPDISYSISCTTRSPRGNEVDGKDYHFMTEAEFDRRVKNGEFLEHAVVHDHKYGTLRKPVADAVGMGKSVVMVIDVAGAGQIREHVKRAPRKDILREAFVDIFIEPPSMDALRQRLIGRATDDKKTVQRRLKNAEDEMARRGEYRYRILNDDLETAFARLKEIIEAEESPRS
jgi:guanylate kinase